MLSSLLNLLVVASDTLIYIPDGSKMLFLANEPAKKAEINLLTARDTTGPGF